MLCLLNKASIRKASRLVKWHGFLRVDPALEPFAVRSGPDQQITKFHTVKNLPAMAGDPGLIPGWGRSLGEGNAYPLHYSCLENPMDGEA